MRAATATKFHECSLHRLTGSAFDLSGLNTTNTTESDFDYKSSFRQYMARLITQYHPPGTGITLVQQFPGISAPFSGANIQLCFSNPLIFKIPVNNQLLISKTRQFNKKINTAAAVMFKQHTINVVNRFPLKDLACQLGANDTRMICGRFFVPAGIPAALDTICGGIDSGCSSSPESTGFVVGFGGTGVCVLPGLNGLL